jgi:hypothetical protein
MPVQTASSKPDARVSDAFLAAALVQASAVTADDAKRIMAGNVNRGKTGQAAAGAPPHKQKKAQMLSTAAGAKRTAARCTGRCG